MGRLISRPNRSKKVHTNSGPGHFGGSGVEGRLHVDVVQI
jgi:hypothetical protein